MERIPAERRWLSASWCITVFDRGSDQPTIGVFRCCSSKPEGLSTGPFLCGMESSTSSLWHAQTRGGSDHVAEVASESAPCQCGCSPGTGGVALTILKPDLVYSTACCLQDGEWEDPCDCQAHSGATVAGSDFCDLVSSARCGGRHACPKAWCAWGLACEKGGLGQECGWESWSSALRDSSCLWKQDWGSHSLGLWGMEKYGTNTLSGWWWPS